MRFLTFLFFVSQVAVAQVAPKGRFSVVQGVTDAHSVQFTIVHRQDQSLRFSIRDEVLGLTYPASAVQVATRPFSSWVVARVSFRAIPDLAEPTLLIEDNQEVLDRRPFHFLKLEQRRLKIALVSCAASYLYSASMWQQVSRANPDLLLFLGDNVYADRLNLVTKRPADPKQLWEQYLDARQKYEIYFRPHLIPSLATWDDHDYGKDDGDRHYEHAEASRQVFEEFWPLGDGISPVLEHGPGIARAVSIFGMDFVFLDNRLFRTAAGEPQITTWGAVQRQWLKELLGKRTQPLWLINGEQFFGGYRGFYSVESNFVEDFNWVLALIKDSKRAVALLSGDIHYSEVMELEPELLGYPSVEITSSSIHSTTVPGQHARFANPRRRAAISDHNFVLLEVGVQDRRVEGTATSIGNTGQVFFTWPVHFGELPPAANE